MKRVTVLATTLAAIVSLALNGGLGIVGSFPWSDGVLASFPWSDGVVGSFPWSDLFVG